MRTLFRLWMWCACLVGAALLGGCATARLIDSDVETFSSGAGASQPASYRFERLPSQATAHWQDRLEAQTAQALAKVGLSLDASAPRYAVQVVLQVQTLPAPQFGPNARGFWRHHDERRLGPPGFGFGLLLEPSWTRHTVRLLLRELATGQVVYETTARFDGPWNDSARLVPAVLDAALQGYPQAPQGPRRVVVELPGEEP